VLVTVVEPLVDLAPEAARANDDDILHGRHGDTLPRPSGRATASGDAIPGARARDRDHSVKMKPR
jgi:hypothetical protein